MRGAYRGFDPPQELAYEESHDTSPLRIDVEVALEQHGNVTRYTQTLHYASTAECDEECEGDANSTRETLAKLAKHLSK